MGVKSLWKLLEPGAQQVPLDNLAYKTLAIDASIWLYQFVKILYTLKNKKHSHFLNTNNDDENEFLVESPHVLGFFKRICKLLYLGVTPVFVFDGPPPKLKLETLAARRHRKEGAALDATKTAQQILHTQLKLTALNPVQVPTASALTYLRKKPSSQADEYVLPKATDFSTITWLASQTMEDTRLPWLTSEITSFTATSDPTTLQKEHQRLHELKNETRRPSHQRLKTMLQQSKTPLDFSKQQLYHLVQRNQVTQQIHDLEKSKGKSQRIASDRSREYVLVKNESMNSNGAGWRFQPSLPNLSLSTTTTSSSYSEKDPTMSLEIVSPTSTSTSTSTTAAAVSSSAVTSATTTTATNTKNKLDTASFSFLRDYMEVKSPLLESDSESEDEEEEFEVVPVLTLPSSLKALVPLMPSSFTRVFSLGTDLLTLALTWTTKQLHASYTDCQTILAQLASCTDTDSLDWRDRYESYVFWEEYLDHVMAYQESKRTETMSSELTPMDFGGDVMSSMATFASTGKNQRLDPPQKVTCMDPVDMKFDGLDAVHPKQRHRGQHLTAFSEDDVFASSDLGHLPLVDNVISKKESSGAGKSENECLSLGSLDSLLLTKTTTGLTHPAPSPLALDSSLDFPSLPEIDEKRPSSSTFSSSADNEEEVYISNLDPLSSPNSLDTCSSFREELNESLTSEKAVKATINTTSEREQEEEEEEEEFEEISCRDPDDTKSIVTSPLPMPVPATIPPLSNSASQSVNVAPLTQSTDITHLASSLSPPSFSKTNTSSIPIPSSSNVPSSSSSLIRLPLPSEEEKQSLTTTTPVASPPSNEKKDLFELRVELEKEQAKLTEAYEQRSREAATVTDAMLEDIQCLLRYFGIPYIEAPSEAEAQCAYLSMMGVVDGVISDDNDVFLFGATHVYRHFFQDHKSVTLYKASTVMSQCGYTRSTLIDLAYLLGSDYTEGVPGIGPKTAHAIVHEFTSLQAFLSDPKAKQKYRGKFDPTYLPSHFPDPRVAQAYLHPDVLPLQRSDVSWTPPQVDLLTTFLCDKLVWPAQKVKPMVDHVLQNYQARTQAQQRDLHFYYAPVSKHPLSDATVSAHPSKKVKKGETDDPFLFSGGY